MKKTRNTATFKHFLCTMLCALGVVFTVNFAYADEFYGANENTTCDFTEETVSFQAEYCKECTEESLLATTCSLSINEDNECVYTAKCLSGYENLDNSDPANPSCSPISFKITYNKNGGSWKSGYTPITTYTIAGSDITLPDAENIERDGYTFAEWTTSGNPITEIPHDSMTNIEVTAQWEPISYTITYDTNGGSWKSDYTPITTYTIAGSDITLPDAENIERDGYTFAGWTTSGNPITEIPHDSMTNIELTAQWTISEYTCDSRFSVVFDDGGTKACLSSQKPDSASSPLVMVFQIDGERYYLAMTPNAGSLPISATADIKMKVLYNNKEYNVHDLSVSVE